MFRRSEGRSFLILVDRRDVRMGRNEGEVTEGDQRISKDRREKSKDKGLKTESKTL